jgi:hypothetical protein
MKIVTIPAIGEARPVPGWHGVVSGGGPNPFPDSPKIPEHFKGIIKSGPNPFGRVAIPDHLKRVVQSGPDPFTDAPKALEHMGTIVASGSSPFLSALKSREPLTSRFWHVSGDGNPTNVLAGHTSPTSPSNVQGGEEQPQPEDIEMADAEQEGAPRLAPIVISSGEEESEYED